MTRIPLVSPEDEPEALRATFDQLRTTRGRVPAMYRTLAHHPAILQAHRAYFHAALDSGVLPRGFKEKIAYRVAVARGSDYSSGSHHSYALRHGVPEIELAAIRAGDYRALEPRERVALDFADAFVSGRGKVQDDIFDALSRSFGPAEVIEIVALIGVMGLASDYGEVFQLSAE